MSAARKVSRRGSRRGFMRGFRGEVSHRGQLRLPPFSVQRHRAPSSAALHPRAPRSRPNVATLRAPLSSTKMQRSPKRRSAALPQAPTQHCTFPKRQDATLPTKTLRCPPRCRVAPSAAMLRASEHRSAAHPPNGKSSPMFAVRLRKRTHDSRIHAEFPSFYSQYAAARSFRQRTSASFCQIEASASCVGRAMLPC